MQTIYKYERSNYAFEFAEIFAIQLWKKKNQQSIICLKVSMMQWLT